ALLYLVSHFTAKGANADTFYMAGRRAPWTLVSYGMIGVAISGITFISVPGEVQTSAFSYFQLVIGYALGLILVALVLLPIYYKSRVISIYSYLENRFGYYTHKSGALFFMLTHLLGASFRLYLMAFVLQLIAFDALNIPFFVTVFITIILIWLYTYKGGIKTIIFTDVLQTTFLLLAIILCIYSVAQHMQLSLAGLNNKIWSSEYSKIFYWSWDSPYNFFKLVLTGMLLTIVANGLDQAIMQKHLTCPRLIDAKKNIITLAFVLLIVNLIILFLGAALVLYASEFQVILPGQTDQIYPRLAVNHLGSVAGVAFIVGIAAAAYSSADSSLTGLTTSFCVDFLGYQTHRADNSRVRKWVHLGFSILIFVFIILFHLINNESVVSAFIRISGYTAGPLLGLFTFGIISKRKVHDRIMPLVCLTAPLLSYFVNRYSPYLFQGYQLGYEIIVVNAILTLIGIYLFSKNSRVTK
ncbi:MAG: sodium:solute symporter, partial [Saprospiraceae bacterium]|nr:sodium:solute symporter [Saprospiraceae bacterium]